MKAFWFVPFLIVSGCGEAENPRKELVPNSVVTAYKNPDGSVRIETVRGNELSYLEVVFTARRGLGACLPDPPGSPRREIEPGIVSP